MDGYYSLFSPELEVQDEAPLDLIFAQHYLQKLNLVSKQNFDSMSACIAHRLNVAEKLLTGSDCYPCAGKYLAQIAEARARLDKAGG
jgi:hypothetical protein